MTSFYRMNGMPQTATRVGARYRTACSRIDYEECRSTVEKAIAAGIAFRPAFNVQELIPNTMCTQCKNEIPGKHKAGRCRPCVLLANARQKERYVLKKAATA